MFAGIVVELVFPSAERKTISISLLLLLDNIRFSISPCCGTVLADDEDERMIHRQKMTRRKEMGMFMVLFVLC